MLVSNLCYSRYADPRAVALTTDLWEIYQPYWLLVYTKNQIRSPSNTVHKSFISLYALPVKVICQKPCIKRSYRSIYRLIIGSMHKAFITLSAVKYEIFLTFRIFRAHYVIRLCSPFDTARIISNRYLIRELRQTQHLWTWTTIRVVSKLNASIYLRWRP